MVLMLSIPWREVQSKEPIKKTEQLEFKIRFLKQIAL